jgi:hypothetical protein
MTSAPAPGADPPLLCDRIIGKSKQLPLERWPEIEKPAHENRRVKAGA